MRGGGTADAVASQRSKFVLVPQVTCVPQYGAVPARPHHETDHEKSFLYVARFSLIGC